MGTGLRRAIGLALMAVALGGCGVSAHADPGPYCAHLQSLRHLVVQAKQAHPTDAALLQQVEALESDFQQDAMTLGSNGDAVRGASAARIAVALGAWRMSLSTLTGDDQASREITQAIAQAPGCA